MCTRSLGSRRDASRFARKEVSLAALLCIAAIVAPAMALAGRPPESRDAERRALDLEMDLLHKKIAALGNGVALRQEHVKKRLRALYKISQGGYLRLLVSAETPAELFERRNGVQRVIRRDLEELESNRRELGEVEAERAELRDRERRSAALDAAAWDTVPGRLTRKEALYRPVPGKISAPFGKYRDPVTGLAATRDGVELTTRPGDAVRAIAPGTVRAVAEVPGLGLAIIVDHGDGWTSLLGRLADPQVTPGAVVKAGQRLAAAQGPSVQLQLAEGGAWLDPTSWLAR